MKALGTEVVEFLVGLFAALRDYQDAKGFDGPPIHDPCTIAYFTDSTIVETQKASVDVELTGAVTTGMAVADFRAPVPTCCHTQVATKLVAPRFWDLLIDAIKRLG